MRNNKIDIITLGCSKNLVDSELLMRQFAANGYAVSHDPEETSGNIVVINTCGFIGDAKEESINMILEFAAARKTKHIQKLFVMGCLSERYREELKELIPEVDKFYGKFNWKELISDLGKSYYQELSNERLLTTPSHYSYLKIAEGCNRTCAYCSIPLITGKYTSKSIETIEQEVKSLVKQGVKEFQLIAQDLTYYGKDIYKKYNLAELFRRISDIAGVEWIRLHYAYPHAFPAGFIAGDAGKRKCLQVFGHRVATQQRCDVEKDATEYHEARNNPITPDNPGRSSGHSSSHHDDGRISRGNRRGLR
ncbi:hypothetical protein FACS189421_13700 [Bacteroidia bacterium]|nr:hypothetical protein FACS189421_13700 [Bacteroidia bacterium]